MFGKIVSLIIASLPGLASLYEKLVQVLEQRAERKAVEISKKNKDTSGLENLFNGK